ncbi:MAG: DUF3006 domain-containing protein [Nitrososphaera sp.]|jgi:hypothetical protein
MEKRVIKASYDRIEGEHAIIYSDTDFQRFDVPLELVDGAKPGMRLELHVENGIVKKIEIDADATRKAKDRIRSKYEKLRQGRHLK